MRYPDQQAVRPDSFLAPYVRVHILVWLSIALVPAVAITAGVTRAYRNEQRALAAEWQARGDAALSAGSPAEAIEAFRNALMFAREDRAVTLKLAQALAALGRGAEARAYLLALWDEQPGSGEVNLALARLEAERHDVDRALRYYHIAVEGAWHERADAHRRAARFELAEFLLRERALVQAQAEAMALSGSLPADEGLRLRGARLLLDAALPRRALTIYEEILGNDPDHVAALEGAGRAAFADGNYAAAAGYLGRAIRRGREDDSLKEMSDTARLIVSVDPFQRRLSVRERVRRVARAFTAALSRLDACASRMGSDASLQALVDESSDFRRKADARALARNPDLADPVMELVFRIERRTADLCGPPAGLDRALLLLAQAGQGTGP
jgi:predicted Zn-dependent protease